MMKRTLLAKAVALSLAGIVVASPSMASTITANPLNRTGVSAVDGVEIDTSAIGRIDYYDSKNTYRSCTAVVVDKNVVATAKHCIFDTQYGKYFRLKKSTYSYTFKVIGEYRHGSGDLAFLALSRSVTGRVAGDVAKPANMWMNLRTENRPSSPNLATIMGYTMNKYHKDGSSSDLEKCANMQIDQARTTTSYLRVKGVCWDYKNVTNPDGTVTRTKISGPVIYKGASGGAIFALSKERVPYMLAVFAGYVSLKLSDPNATIGYYGYTVSDGVRSIFEKAKALADAEATK